MTSSSQGHKLQVRGINSEGIMAPIADVAIADVANDTTGTITPIDGAAAFSNAAAVNTNNLVDIIYTFSACPGLDIDAGTGEITGTPTTNGVYKCVVVASVDGAAVRSNIFTITIADPAAVLTGTAITGGVTEAQIATGGETIIITLTADTCVATVAADNAITDAIIAGIDGDVAAGTGWDAKVKAPMAFTDITRDSATQVTIVLPAGTDYAISTDETVTVTIPATALTISASAVVATPVITVTNAA